MSKQMAAAGRPAWAGCCTPLTTQPLTGAQATTLAPMFKALGDPTRLRLLSLIATRDQVCVCDLTDTFEVSGPTISHHLKVLREAGLVDSERRGTWVFYSVRPGVLRQLAELFGVSAPAPA